MHILIVNNTRIPALRYGGTERVIWWLGKALVGMGHKVSYLVAEGSSCPFADVYVFNPDAPFAAQIPAGVDFVHLNHMVNALPPVPYLMTMHGNMNHSVPLYSNTVFVSANHAARFGSTCYVHNGIDPDDYGKPDFNNERSYAHFLGDAAWRVKNVRGAIRIAKRAGVPLEVIGGYRFNFNQGIRLTFDWRVHFHGMKGGAEKNRILNGSRALVFPVRWHEPFGLALVESLYFGCPVMGTPYGSLPEIVVREVGVLSAHTDELVKGLQSAGDFNRAYCHDYAAEQFSSFKMAKAYLGLYEKILNGQSLHTTPPQLVQVQAEKFLPFD